MSREQQGRWATVFNYQERRFDMSPEDARWYARWERVFLAWYWKKLPHEIDSAPAEDRDDMVTFLNVRADELVVKKRGPLAGFHPSMGILLLVIAFACYELGRILGTPASHAAP